MKIGDLVIHILSNPVEDPVGIITCIFDNGDVEVLWDDDIARHKTQDLEVIDESK